MNTSGHVARHRQKVTDLLQLAGVTTIGQITAPRVAAALEKMRAAGSSHQTCNHYIQAVTQFTRWASHPDQRRLEDDPLERRMKRYNVRTDRRHQRRALTVAEMTAILAATIASTARRSVEMQPVDRWLLYRVAVETGLRAGELRALTVGSFKLGATAVVEYRAEDDKAGRGGQIPLRLGLSMDLVQWWLHRDPASPAFPRMPEKPVKMWRRDLARAGVPYRTAEGVADFHSLRHTCGSWLLAAGVGIKVVQQIMRHSDINLTMDRYGHAFQEDQRAAVEMFGGTDSS
jgi:integrase